MSKSKSALLSDLYEKTKLCQKCSLSLTRHGVVCGIGNCDSDIFLLGEAPGGEEDLTGVPFCGQAGQVLDNFLQQLAISKENIYIGNLVKCRPTKPSNRGRYGPYANRKPTKSEINVCSPWFLEELSILQPKSLITLGAVPLGFLLGYVPTMGKMHGLPFYHQQLDIDVFPLYHPAAIIYDRSKQVAYDKDLLTLKLWLNR